MNRIATLLLFVVIVVLPMTGRAQVLLTGTLDGSQVTPPVTTSGRGTAWAVLNSSTKTLTYRMTFARMNGMATGAHFHAGGTGGGNILTDIDFAGNTVTGSWANVPDSVIDHLLAGEIYINVHSNLNPGGEIQGTLQVARGTGFTISMDASQEPGQIVSTAEGTGYAILDSMQTNLAFGITFAGLSGTYTASHFHVLPSPVVHAISFVDSTASGVWTGLSAENVTSLLHGDLYANVHSSKYPGGEIRGALVFAGPQAPGTADVKPQLAPAAFSLEQNYPNPFNPETRIGFGVSPARLSGSQEAGEGQGSTWVRLSVFDLLGREVAVLVNEKKESGRYEVKWDGSKYSSGVYMYRLTNGESVESRKMLLTK
jgi:hypothetical protein